MRTTALEMFHIFTIHLRNTFKELELTCNVRTFKTKKKCCEIPIQLCLAHYFECQQVIYTPRPLILKQIIVEFRMRLKSPLQHGLFLAFFFLLFLYLFFTLHFQNIIDWNFFQLWVIFIFQILESKFIFIIFQANKSGAL